MCGSLWARPVWVLKHYMRVCACVYVVDAVYVHVRVINLLTTWHVATPLLIPPSPLSPMFSEVSTGRLSGASAPFISYSCVNNMDVTTAINRDCRTIYKPPTLSLLKWCRIHQCGHQYVHHHLLHHPLYHVQLGRHLVLGVHLLVPGGADCMPDIQSIQTIEKSHTWNSLTQHACTYQFKSLPTRRIGPSVINPLSAKDESSRLKNAC